MKEKQQQFQVLEIQLRQKQRHIDQLQRKLDIKKQMGAEITPEGAIGFEKCCSFFELKVEQTEELGDTEAHDIDEFISRYENSAQIT